MLRCQPATFGLGALFSRASGDGAANCSGTKDRLHHDPLGMLTSGVSIGELGRALRVARTDRQRLHTEPGAEGARPPDASGATSRAIASINAPRPPRCRHTRGSAVRAPERLPRDRGVSYPAATGTRGATRC